MYSNNQCVLLFLFGALCMAGLLFDTAAGTCFEIPNCETCKVKTVCTACNSTLVGLKVLSSKDVICDSCNKNAYCEQCINMTYCTRCNDTTKYGPDLKGVGTCSRCIANCHICTQSGGGKCDVCNNGYALQKTPSYSCIPCADNNCNSCSFPGKGACFQCSNGYGLNGTTRTCSLCTTNCQKCNVAGGGSCNGGQCSPSYGNFGSSCITSSCTAGSAGCAACSNTANDSVSCSQCSSGYTLNPPTSTTPGSCSAFVCTTHCKTCSTAGAGSCDGGQCSPSYGNFGSSCVTPTCTAGSSGCATCSNTATDTASCSQCSLGYTLTPATSTTPASCSACTSNCKTCSTAGAGSCDGGQCSPSYGNFGSSCVTPACTAGSSGCATCSNTPTDTASCSQCSAGYALTPATSTTPGSCSAFVCGSYCQNCSAAGPTLCDTCNAGYHTASNKTCVVNCAPGSSSCFTCDSDKINCDVCPTGYNQTTSPANMTTCTPPTTTIPDKNCSFPFTYNEELYYSCILSSPGKYVCLGPNRLWMFCQTTSADGSLYVAQNTTTALSFTGYPGTTNVTTVNGWIVMQQRISASVNFSQTWVTYRNGFGLFNGNFWLGNEKIHQLTGSGGWMLRVEMLLSDNHGWYSAEYTSFAVQSEGTNYTLILSGFSGDTGDSLSMPDPNFGQNNTQFTTYDRKHNKGTLNNAGYYQGGFWYLFDCNACLNSAYNKYILWYISPPGVCQICPLITVRMMIKKHTS